MSSSPVVRRLSSDRIGITLDDPGGTGYTWEPVETGGAELLSVDRAPSGRPRPGGDVRKTFVFRIQPTAAPRRMVFELRAPFADEAAETRVVELD